MLTLEVEFLTGHYVAARRDDRSAVEWPPHPTRLFSALAAALFECDLGAAEREALEWLERQQPPALSVPPASVRTPVAVFVPVNDSNDAYIKRSKKTTVFSRIDEGTDLRRSRQLRFFPTIVPEESRVLFCWEATDTSEVDHHRDALKRLAANVTYLGHSSSLVQVTICETPPQPTLRPAAREELADATLRVPGPERLASLQRAYVQSQRVNRRIEPPEGIFQAYIRVGRSQETVEVHSLFDPRMIVFRCKEGQRLPLHACLKLTATVRKALIEQADEPVPEVISGHEPDGQKSSRPHLAVVPLANVGHRYSDGTIMGFAIVLPRALGEPQRGGERRTVLKAIGRLETLRLGSLGDWHLERLTAESPHKTLQPDHYTGPSRRWATITPTVFGRFPKSLESEDARDMVRENCRMIGLPQPKRVEIVLVSPVLAVPPSPHFATLSTDGKPVGPLFDKGRHRLPRGAAGQPQARPRAHVVLDFEQRVLGPVLLGAGRYLGMGFCMPIHQTRD